MVRDSGIGIPPDALPYVFDRFWQAHPPGGRPGGLGLGLSIVRQLVELHGGSVSAASDGEGQGSTFRVTLPTMILHPHAADGAGEHPRSTQAFPAPAREGLAGVQILAVDDDSDALGLLRAVFEAAGAAVHGFTSAVAALNALDSLQPQVMVVDLGMPQMDGFEFIRRVRRSANPALADTPAAALTAFARSEDRVKAMRAGFEMHLAKPVDPGELVAAVQTLVRRVPRRD
jgi:CheY-like chemotaxis protein